MDDSVMEFTTPRAEIEAVVFDAGGTLVRIDFEWMCETLAGFGLQVTHEEMRRAEVQGRRRYDSLAGVAPRTPVTGPHPALGSVGPTHAYFSGMLEAVGCRHPVLEEALNAVWEAQTPPRYLWSRPVEGARHALDALAAMGVRACCVSNSDGRAEQILEDCGVRDGLEFVVDSQVEGVEKPDPRIFTRALDRLGLSAERTVYVGDIRSVDAAGARNAGMHFTLIDPFGDYAEGLPSVRRIEELPSHLASRFTLVPAGGSSRPALS